MGSVSPFPLLKPHRSAPPPASAALPASSATVLPSTGGRRGEYALGDIARALGLAHFTPRVIIEKLRVLAKHQGMPLPRTARIVSGVPVIGPNSIYAHSRWDAGEFDAWNEGGRTGPGGAAARPPVPAPLRDAINQRALLLARVA